MTSNTNASEERKSTLKFRQCHLKIELKHCIVLSVLLCLIWIISSLPIILFHFFAQQQESAVHTAIDDLIPGPTNTFNATLLIQNCSKGFTTDPSSGYCVPVCGEWSEFSQDTTRFFIIISTILFAIHTLGNVIALCFCCYNYKTMLKFPSILLVYYLVVHSFTDILYAISSIGRDPLLCSSSDLLQTIDVSTPFCSFSGAGTIFSLTIRGYWWLSHTIAVFWSVWFPFQTRKILNHHTGYTKFIHFATVVIVFTLSVIPVGAIFATGGYVLSSYTVSLSTNCIPRNLTAASYIFSLPICVIVPTGITFNILTVWKLLKIRLRPNQRRYYTAEFKLLCFFFYYSIATTFGLAVIGARLGQYQQNQQLYSDYFFCESFGIVADNPCVLEVDGYRDRSLLILSYATFIFTPYIILIYILPVERLTKSVKLNVKKLIGSRD